MERIEKTVFLSYRRTNFSWALAIYKELTHSGYDVFMDYTGITAGDFESAILGNITSRAHFLVLLTPSALERCGESGDWLRREVETAFETQRNVIPIMLEGFDFGSPAISSQLTGKLTDLRRCNGISVVPEYFDAGMSRLREFLDVPLSRVPRRATTVAKDAAAEQRAAADAAPAVQKKELTAQEWFERGYAATDLDEQIRCYSEAIRLDPTNAYSFNNRSFARCDRGDYDGATQDCNEAIRLDPDNGVAFNNRGRARYMKDDLDGAMHDYNEAIRLNPKYAIAFFNRAIIRKAQGDLNEALQDYDEAIRLDPHDADAFNGRGSARKDKGDLDGAIKDYNKAIRLRPDYAEALNSRGDMRCDKGDYDGAIEDCNEAVRLKPDYAIALNNLGRALYNKNDLDAAMENYNEAIRLKPDLANAFYNRALVYQERVDFAAAIADYQKYLDLGGGRRDGDQAKVEGWIRDLKKKLKPKPRKK